MSVRAGNRESIITTVKEEDRKTNTTYESNAPEGLTKKAQPSRQQRRHGCGCTYLAQ